MRNDDKMEQPPPNLNRDPIQDCLVNNNRNWKSCQMEVQALKACNQKRMKNDKEK
ncbi:hypothetical protein Pint_24976 [Pistacia integerrima]|uniref:Uncharacterized protein n=1 Tax=Pistacia integerrima TaxID=434235 RepID=A0ACC0YDX5_9ROSI|nr:hypothetical protein Pint_24976 [Pistacia integerrima]